MSVLDLFQIKSANFNTFIRGHVVKKLQSSIERRYELVYLQDISYINQVMLFKIYQLQFILMIRLAKNTVFQQIGM